MRDIVLPAGTVVMLYDAVCVLQTSTVVQSAEIARYPSLEAFLEAQGAASSERRRREGVSVQFFGKTYDVWGGRVDGTPMLQLRDPLDDSLFVVATFLHRDEGQGPDDVWVRADGRGDDWLYRALREGDVVEPFLEERRDALGRRTMLRCRLTPRGRRLVS